MSRIYVSHCPWSRSDSRVNLRERLAAVASSNFSTDNQPICKCAARYRISRATNAKVSEIIEASRMMFVLFVPRATRWNALRGDAGGLLFDAPQAPRSCCRDVNLALLILAGVILTRRLLDAFSAASRSLELPSPGTATPLHCSCLARTSPAE